MISITLIGAFFATNIFASASEVIIEAQMLSPEVRLSQEEFKERYLASATILTHRVANEHITSQIQKAEIGAILSRKDHVQIDKSTKQEILILSIQGLLEKTGQFTHMVLGRKGDVPVIYVDSNYFYNEGVFTHDKDNIYAAQLAYRLDSDLPEFTELIIVPGHGIFTGNSKNDIIDPAQWAGRFPEENIYYIEHIKKGVELAAKNPEALLFFSGGQVQKEAEGISEALGYHNVSSLSGWWEHPEVEKRSFVEGGARDSFENMLLSVLLFKERTGRFPSKITVAGWGFKKERFEQHCKALDIPLRLFQYIEVNNPPEEVLLKAKVVEAKKLKDAIKDPLMEADKQKKNRAQKNPFSDRPRAKLFKGKSLRAIIASIKTYYSKGSPADLLIAIRDNDELLLKVLSKEGITSKEITGHRSLSRGTIDIEFKILKSLDILIPAEKPYHYRFSNMITGQTIEHTKLMIDSIISIEHAFGTRGDDRPLHRWSLTATQIPVVRRLITDMLMVQKSSFISKTPELPSLGEILALYNGDYVRHHAQRVERIAALIAEDMGLSEDITRSIRLVAASHDFGAPKTPIPDYLAKGARNSLAEKGIILPAGNYSYDYDLYQEIKALLGEKSAELDITDIEIDAAQDIFQGPASLDYLSCHEVDLNLLSPAENTAILMHHHIGELENYLAQQDWDEDEKNKARIITSVLVTSDVIENGINHFKKIFFRTTSLIETPEETLVWIKKTGIPEPYLAQTCSSFKKIAQTEEFLDIKQDAWEISTEEYEELRSVGRIPYYLVALPDLFSQYKSTYVQQHAERASRIAVLLARQLGYNEEIVKKVRFSTAAHDFGAPKSPIQCDDVRLLRERLQSKLDKAYPKKIVLPEGQSPLIILYLRIKKEFRDNPQNYTEREKAYALDLFRGPAALSHLNEIGISTQYVFLTRSQSIAIQYHHNLSELVSFLETVPLIEGEELKRESWTEEEIMETIIIASILSASDCIENGMNYFKKRFFNDASRIETLQETKKKWLGKLNIPKPYKERILAAFDKISLSKEFQGIRVSASTLTSDEKLDLRRINRPFSSSRGDTETKGSPAELLVAIRDNADLLSGVRNAEIGLTGMDLFPHRDFEKSTVYQEIQILRDTGIFVQCAVRDSKKYYSFPEWIIGTEENHTKTMINAINNIHYKMRKRGDERPFHRGNIVGAPKKDRLVAKELAKMAALYQIAKMQKPILPEGKVLWHIIDREVLSDHQANSSFIQNINNASIKSDAPERIYIPGKNESLIQAMRKIKGLSPKAYFDVALGSTDKINRVPTFNNGNEIKILVFSHEGGDFTQVGGMVSALRALHLQKERVIPSLLMIYSAMNGSSYEGELSSSQLTALLDNPKEFAQKFVFTLPPADRLPVRDIIKLNEILVKLLTSA